MTTVSVLDGSVNLESGFRSATLLPGMTATIQPDVPYRITPTGAAEDDVSGDSPLVRVRVEVRGGWDGRL